MLRKKGKFKLDTYIDKTFENRTKDIVKCVKNKHKNSLERKFNFDTVILNNFKNRT